MTDVQALFDAVQGHAQRSGFFEQVNGHETKSAPGAGITAALWVQRLDPLPAASGLNETTGRVLFFVRLYQNFIAEPQDAIDPSMLAATIALIGAYSGDFTLGGLVKNVDLLGMYGTPLSAEAGYIPQDGTMFRSVTITLPLVVNDIWEQVA